MAHTTPVSFPTSVFYFAVPLQPARCRFTCRTSHNSLCARLPPIPAEDAFKMQRSQHPSPHSRMNTALSTVPVPFPVRLR